MCNFFKNRLSIAWDGTLVTGRLTNWLGMGIKGQQVSLYVDGTAVDHTTTGTSGSYSFEYPFKPGTYTVGTVSTVPSPTITITVTAALSAISLSASSESVNTGATVTFSGKATDGGGNGMGGLTLNVNEGPSGGTLTQIQTVTTAADGTFSFTLPFNTAGKFDVNVTS